MRRRIEGEKRVRIKSLRDFCLLRKTVKRLNIIGCGKVGKTLGRLWAQAGFFEIGEIVNRSPDSAAAAVGFIGAGTAASGLAGMKDADLYLIGTPDRVIAEVGGALSASGLLKRGAVVFHCSGAFTSAELASAAKCGAALASVHPVKSFAEPEQAVATFAGTYCGAEGDEAALQVLTAAFSAIGARLFSIDAAQKTLYHAAGVIVCNYLTALIECGLRVYAQCGITREQALPIIEPVVRETVDNVFKLGTVRALTGPVARGDCPTVAVQIEALDAWSRDCGELYRRLGAIALELSREQGAAPAESLALLSDLFRKEEERHA